MTTKQPKYVRSARELEAPEGAPVAGQPDPRNEFRIENPDQLLLDPVDRRNFLGLVSSSMALAGVSLSGCVRKPQEHIMPYTKRPEDLVPGKPRYFATAAQLTGGVIGLLVESQDGRPTKIEGNPRHPMSGGATDAFTQASVLEPYEPCRVRDPRVNGRKISFGAMDKRLDRLAAGLGRGAGLALLVQERHSPTFTSMISRLLTHYPEARVYRHDVASPDNARAGAELVGLKGAQPLLHLERADRVLAIDSDFLALEGDAVRNARRFAWRRRVSSPQAQMNRLYAVEANFSVTGANADHRLRLAPSLIGEFLADLCGYLGGRGIAAPTGAEALVAALGKRFKEREGALPYLKYLRAAAGDLLAHRRRALVVVGNAQPPRVHALGHLLNGMLESFGRTLELMPSSAGPVQGGIAHLVKEANAGRVRTLVVLGGNPVYDAPGDLDFAAALKKVPLSLALSLMDNETTQAVHWVVPASHYLETWGELVATDGTLTIQQPLFAPLVPSLSEIELLSQLLRERKKGHQLVRERWAVGQPDERTLDLIWRRALHDGAQRQNTKPLAAAFDWRRLGEGALGGKAALSAAEVDVVFARDYSVYDGRFASLSWLQELPDPISKLTWDNAALVSLSTAKTLKLKNEQLLSIAIGGRKVTLPVWIVPGVADHTVVLPLGYGRTKSGQVADSAGFNVYGLRSVAALHFASGAKLDATVRGSYRLASTQDHGTMVEPKTGHKRPIAIEGTIDEYRAYDKARKAGEMNFAKKQAQLLPDDKLKSIYAETNVRTGQQWGMSIDLSACIGCNACTVACQAENNIPPVGKKEVLNGRELHWIRMDRYYVHRSYDGVGQVKDDDVSLITQPVACMQCETAPCENVCPVGATAHSPEGLNDMAYNRCIGTRYCGNNCPYKVRRFNFFNYTGRQDESHPAIAMQRNPDVTVRFRGVMEKCTYCVQRINGAKIDAKVKGNGIVVDGAIVPACQQVCPTGAIVFGDVANPTSAVSKLKQQTRDYGLLADLNTKPRTTYLAKIRNPNPELA